MYTTKKMNFSHVSCVVVVSILVLITPAFAGTTNNPAIIAAISQSIITKGDSLLITGTTMGNPSNGVAIWIIGPGVSSSKPGINYLNRVTVQPDTTGKFSYEIDSSVTATMGSGTGYIIVQHPMNNNAFDILLVNGRLGKSPSINFSDDYKNKDYHAYWGPDGTGYLALVHIPYSPGGVIGGDVEDILIEALKDPNVDDSYAEIQFSVVAPTTTSPTPTATTAITTTAIPIVSGISPTSGSTLGGTVVTITGSGFSNVGVKWVMFGSTPVGATGIYNTGGSTNSITAISPPSSVGTVDITVLTDRGTTTPSAATQYTYTAPTTTVATTAPTTLATTSPTAQVTTIQTTITTTPPTTVPTQSPTFYVTTVSTSNIEKLLAEQNKKIDDQNKLIAEQNKKIADQSDILMQLVNYLKRIFSWV